MPLIGQVFTEGRHPAEFVMTEGEGHISREQITVASGAGVLVAGTVVGMRAAAGGTVTPAVKAGGNTGTGTMTMDAAPVRENAIDGTYRVRLTAAGVWTVYDPRGNAVDTVAVGAAFANQIAFTTAAGGTAFVVGDGFDVRVSVSGKYVASPDAATDGSEDAAAILLYGVDATAADVAVAAIVRQAEVNGKTLTYDVSVASNTAVAAKVTQLRRRGIIVR